MDSQSPPLSTDSQDAITAATTPPTLTAGSPITDQAIDAVLATDLSVNTSLTKEDDLAPKTQKTTTAVKTLTADERKKLRAQKFGNNANSQSDNTSVDQKLQKRAQRFGSVVSEQLKKVEDNQKLQKRKERFGAITSTDTSSKRKITSSDTQDRMEKRMARFGKV